MSSLRRPSRLAHIALSFLLATFGLASAALVSHFVTDIDTALVGFTAVVALGTLLVAHAYSLRRDILSPSVWFIPTLIVLTGGIIPAVYSTGRSGWFSRPILLAGSQYNTLLAAIATAAVFFYLTATLLDLLLPEWLHARRGPKQPTRSGSYPELLSQTAMLLATASLVVAIALRGGTQWLTTAYGAGQFRRDTAYYIYVAAQLFWFPAFSLYAALLWARDAVRQRWPRLVIYILLFVGPLAVYGSRKAVLYAAALLLVTRVLGRRKRVALSRIGMAVVALAYVLTVILSWRHSRQFSLSELHLAEPLVGLGRAVTATGGVAVMVMRWFPSQMPFAGGRTIAGAVASLLPGFLFRASRPFVNPSSMFRALMSPHTVSHGFGFSFIGEAYMSGGIVGCALFGVALAIIVTVVYRLAWEHSSPVFSALYAVVVFQSLWLIRSTVLAYVKGLVYAGALLGIIWLFARQRGVAGRLESARIKPGWARQEHVGL